MARGRAGGFRDGLEGPGEQDFSDQQAEREDREFFRSLKDPSPVHIAKDGLGEATPQWQAHSRMKRVAAGKEEKRTCWATIRNSDPPRRCKKPAMFGQRVCRLHGGATPKGKMSAAKRGSVREMRQIMGQLGLPVEADPRAVLLDQVYHAYGMMQSLASLIASYDTEDLVDDDPNLRMRLRAVQNMYGYWAEKAAQFASLAIRAGIEERLVKLAESQALTVVNVLKGALDKVNLLPEQRQQLLQAVADEMRLLGPAGESRRKEEAQKRLTDGAP